MPCHATLCHAIPATIPSKNCFKTTCTKNPEQKKHERETPRDPRDREQPGGALPPQRRLLALEPSLLRYSNCCSHTHAHVRVLGGTEECGNTATRYGDKGRAHRQGCYLEITTHLDRGVAATGAENWVVRWPPSGAATAEV